MTIDERCIELLVKSSKKYFQRILKYYSLTFYVFNRKEEGSRNTRCVYLCMTSALDSSLGDSGWGLTLDRRILNLNTTR